MYRIFQKQFWVMLNQKGFQACFIGVLCMVLMNTALQLAENYGNYRGYLVDVSAAFILHTDAKLLSIFTMISLFLLLLPYCFTGLKNRELGMELLDLVRSQARAYYCSGALTAFLGTFLAFFVPFLLELVINQILFPETGILGSGLSIYSYNGAATLTGANATEEVLNPGYTLIPIQLFLNHPFLYNCIYAGMYAAWMAILAMFFYSLSFCFKKRIYLLFPVYIFYFLIKRLNDILGMVCGKTIETDFFKYFTVGENHNLSALYICVLLVVLFLLTGLLLRRRANADQGV